MSQSKSDLTRCLCTLMVCLVLCLFSAPASAQEIMPEVFEQLEYRHIGPQGNRVIAAAGVAGDPNIYYVNGLDVLSLENAHLLPDELHPNPAGYRLMGHNSTPIIASIWSSRQKQDQDTGNILP